MLHVLLLSLLSLSLGEEQSCSNSVIPGQITWTNGGTTTTSYIIQAGGSNSWGKVTTSTNSVTSAMGPRFYLANTCATAFGPSVFQKINPNGATLTFTVNLSTMGCGTNAAFYLVGMPAGTAGTNGDYYCDANCVGGSCCSEMDLMEANRHALQITPHKCSSATSGCDANGCARNTQSITNGYGPSSAYTINTSSAFTVSLKFATSGGQLASITSTISQGGKSITLTHDSSCGSGYLAGLTSAFNTGMVPVWSVWSGSMSWLDSPACSSDTNEMGSSSSQMVFSNFIVTGAGAVGAPPPPPPPPPPAAPGTQTCSSTGCTVNQNWVEFNPPTGATNPAGATASVSCSGGLSYSCTWYSAGNKFQCSAPGSGCTSPVPQYNGKACTLVSGEMADADASHTDLDTTTIAGIAVGCGFVVLIVIVVVIVIVTKKRTEEYV